MPVQLCESVNICTEGPALSFSVPGTYLVSERSALDHRGG